MVETIFTLHSTDTNNYSVQKTFTGVNPEATSAELVETAQGFNRLTDNTYVATKRIDKLDADTEASGDGRAEATLTFSQAIDGALIVTAGVNVRFDIFYNGSKLTKAIFETLDNYEIAFDSTSPNIRIGLTVAGDYIEFDIFPAAGFSGPCPVTLTLGGNETYKPVSVTATITA